MTELKQVVVEDETESAVARVLEEVQPLVRSVAALGISSRFEVLRMPEVE